MKTGATVRVENRYGDIRARFGGYEGKLEVLATMQRLREGGPRLEVNVEETTSGFEVVPRYPQGGGGAMQGRDDRADLVIFIPAGVSLQAVTTSGLIEAIGLRGDVAAETEKGEILVKGISGLVHARNAQGPTSVLLEPQESALAQSVESVTGDITLYVRASSSFDVRAATSGEICTDFSLEIEHRDGEEPNKAATARIGKGGPPLRITSKQGGVRLLRLPAAAKPNPSTEGNANETPSSSEKPTA